MPISGPTLSPEEYAHADHSSRANMLLSAQWSLVSFAAAFLALRIHVKISFKKGLWWDDWLLIASWIVCVVVCILTTILIKEFSLGHHTYDIVVPNIPKWINILDSRATCVNTAFAWTKTAFAVTLLRLTMGKTKAFVWFLIITLNIALGFSAMAPWIQCQPVAKRWHIELEGQCWSPDVVIHTFMVTSALSSLYDFILALLPWTFLYTLTLRKKEKVGILVAMSMGAVAGALGIVKCVKTPALGTEDDYNLAPLFIWDIAEACVTLIAACIPTLRVLLRDKTSSGTSDERTTRFSQFSLSFRTVNRGRLMFDTQNIEVIREHSLEKGEAFTVSRTSRDGSAAGSGRPAVAEKTG
ncbi:uncharacterized protein C8A04DRAFT_30542 [Dichotomopilus funicola]|uniref:Rhodopsin domain-containing protein n=1 Tax=Dichotomopilus funicola TaxID=1934379 RepID=A0AAN6UZB2_9PEZI|nr:hypothetical protein C8A04DRAFT_30542 [Dichotomopilus funicola]